MAELIAALADLAGVFEDAVGALIQQRGKDLGGA
jgi:hypothetical protein